jgi:hypothetical protein
MQIEINDREFSTLLAALRFWQRTASNHEPEHIIATNTGLLKPLTKNEIDTLALELNFGDRDCLTPATPT